MAKIYAAYDKESGERLWYDMTKAGVHKALKDCYKRDEYEIKEHESFEDMMGLPKLTEEDVRAFNEMLDSGEIRAIDVEDIP